MTEFRLTQPELVVLARFLLGIPLPPLGLPPDPNLAEKSIDEVVIQTIKQLQAKGLVAQDKEGQWQVEPGLTKLLRTAGYVKRWMTVMVHHRGETPYYVGFYTDDEHIVQHELDATSRMHILRPGPEDMGYAWVHSYIERFAAPTVTDEKRVHICSREDWERAIQARLGHESLPGTAGERSYLVDILYATIWLQLNCLCNVYTGSQEEVTFLLGPERNWMWSAGPCLEGENDRPDACLHGRQMSPSTLKRTLQILWRHVLSISEEV